MEPEIRIVNIDGMEYARTERGEAYGYERAIVVPGDGASRMSVQVYRIPPGKANYPYHWHQTHEEAFFVVDGEGVVETPSGAWPLRPGDVLVCPPAPEGAHKIVNTGAEMLVYVEVDAVSFPEVAWYPRVDGMGVLHANRERNTFCARNRRVPYDDICDGG